MHLGAFLKSVDNRVVRPFMGLLPSVVSKGPPEKMERFLIIRPGGLGDALLLLPAIAALKETYPQVELVILAEARNAQAFSLLPYSCRVVDYTRPDRLLALFMEPPFDVVIDTEQWYGLSALVVRLVKGRFKVGFGTNVRARCFHSVVDYSHEEYEVEAFFRLLKPLGLDPGLWWEKVPFVLRQERLRPDFSPQEKKRLAALFPGASHPSRRWGKEKFLEVARFLVGKGWKVVVVGGPGEREEGSYIASQLPEGWAMDCTGSTSLRETAGVLKACRFLVTSDSGIMHLAWLIGVPTLSLFGPGIVEKWAPRGEDHLVVRLDLSCSPCTRFGMVPPCPHNFACMRNLTPEIVVEALEGFLRRISGC